MEYLIKAPGKNEVYVVTNLKGFLKSLEGAPKERRLIIEYLVAVKVLRELLEELVVDGIMCRDPEPPPGESIDDAEYRLALKVRKAFPQEFSKAEEELVKQVKRYVYWSSKL